MAESRIFEYEPWPMTTSDRGAIFHDVPTMPVLIDRGLGVFSSRGRHQFDGNRPPRIYADGETFAITYAYINDGECPACHGLEAGHRCFL